MSRVGAVAVVGLLLSVFFLVSLPLTSAIAIGDRITLSIVNYGPTSAIKGATVQLAVQVEVTWWNGNERVGTYPANGATVTFTEEHDTQQYKTVTDANGVAKYPYVFNTVGSHRVTVYVSHSIPDELGHSFTAQTSGTWTVSVSDGGGAATPTPQQPTATPAQPTASPRATVAKPTVETPTETPAAQPTVIIVVPPPTVITQVIPGTITEGTGPWGNPRDTVTNKVGPDKLRTTLIDFASNPEDNTAHYNEQVGFANADGWKLTARGEKTYGDASLNYRYSRFTKGTSTLLLAAQGNNSSEKQYDIPGEVLITEKDETFSDTAGFSLFGLEGLAAYAIIAVIGIAILALIVVAAVYYRRQDRDQQR